MKIVPVLVAFHTAEWIQVAVESYLDAFPEDRVLVVDNNPVRGEPGWGQDCERERFWLAAHPKIILVPNRAPPGRITGRTHGEALNVAVEWCRGQGADVLVHFEPDCLVTGRRWRENLLDALERGAWMAGSHRKPWGSIHPTPSAWRVAELRATFEGQPRARDRPHARYAELVNEDAIRAETGPLGTWPWWDLYWDTGERAWFHAAASDRAALVETPGLHHYWCGSTSNRRSREDLIATHPELAPWLERASTRCGSYRVEECPFRTNVQRLETGEVADCGLLGEISGVADPELRAVRRDACDACVASLAETVEQAGGVAGCTADRAATLKAWALEHIETRLPRDGPPVWPKRIDAPCHYLGGTAGFRPRAGSGVYSRLPVYECSHPNHVETTAAECLTCRDWSEGPSTSPVPTAIEQIVPPPPRRAGPVVRQWAVGVTTAPRHRPTLPWCLDSLRRAGWENPRLFIDSVVTIPDRFADLPFTLRDSKIGAWPNYYLALAELLMRSPEADAYMIVQDDCFFHDRVNLREHLEEILWPADPVGAVSLYCSKAYAPAQTGWHEYPDERIWGALAFIFPSESAARFLANPQVLAHRRASPLGLANIDGLIGRWARDEHMPIYYPYPSLAQHIGETSAIWPAAQAEGFRRAGPFAGDEG